MFSKILTLAYFLLPAGVSGGKLFTDPLPKTKSLEIRAEA